MSDKSHLPLELSCEEVQNLAGEGANFHFLDCREPDEYETAHIAGAHLLPMSEIQERVSELEPVRDQRVIIHCHHGGRSLRVAKWLRAQGYHGAQSMAGGIDEWSQRIDPAIPRY